MRLAQQCLFLCALRVSAGVLTLEQAEEVLVQQNLQVLAGRVTADVAEAAQRVAGLRPNPTLQLGAEQFPVWSNIHGSYPRFVSTNGDAGANPTYTGQLSHLIERGRKRELRAEQAGAVTEAAKAQTLDTIRQQLLQLRQAYTAALLAKANLELAQQTDLQYRETERLNEIRLRAGDIAEVDLDRIKAARLSYVQAIEEANLAYAQAIRDVQTLLTAEPQSDLTVAGELLVRPVPLSLAELKAAAHAERPDIAALRKLDEASVTGVKLAEALRKRDVTVGVEYQRVGTDSAVGTVVSFPLFLFHNQSQAIAQAVAQQRLTAVQVRQLRMQVEAEVDKAYMALTSAKRLVDLYEAGALERARGIRKTVEYSYQRGEADLLELLDAQRSTNQTLGGYNQAKAAYENAYWQLIHAVGRRF